MKKTFLAVVCLSVAASASSAVIVSVNATVVHVTGITSGGSVTLVGGLVETYNDAPLLSREVKKLEDGDGDGAVSFDLGRPIPPYSNWIAVDESSQEWGQAPGAVAFTPTILVMPEHFLHPGNSEQNDSLEFPGHEYLEVIVIRSRSEGWRVRAIDGGSDDDDPRPNRRLRVKVPSMRRAHGQGPPPGRLLPSDTIVLLNPRTLSYYVGPVR